MQPQICWEILCWYNQSLYNISLQKNAAFFKAFVFNFIFWTSSNFYPVDVLSQILFKQYFKWVVKLWYTKAILHNKNK